MKNKVFSAILAMQLILYTVATPLTAVMANADTISLKTTEDFIKFSKNCTTDSWSRGKTINLEADIDFSKEDFPPVPSFGGTFNGNGFKICGISVKDKGSYKGVFRYVENGGRISDLTVEAEFVPGGSKSFLGGIAGENSGTLENCSFSGTVKGENVVGGIVGSNTEYGKIILCTSYGNITGENSTGGIAGKNIGFIQNCTNEASVNTVYEEKKNTLTDIETDTASIIESYKNSEEENKEESILGHTDTGGIAGYSSGIMQGCVNRGAIGYNHVGYNVGGICGRQSGYMLGCKNYGTIQGRKDVGGIAGQAEPYILLHTSDKSLQDIKSELNSLNITINKLTADADSIGDSIKVYLDNISSHARGARDTTEVLLDLGTDFVDDNLAEINAQSAILSNTLDKLEPIVDSLEEGGKDLTSAVNSLNDAINSISVSAPELSEDLKKISSALSCISQSEDDFKNANARAKRAINELKNAVNFKSPYKVEIAFSKLSSAIKDIITAKQAISSSVESIEKILSEKPESFESIGINAKKTAELLKTVNSNLKTIISSLNTISNSIDTIITNTEINYDDIKSAAYKMRSAFGYAHSAMEYVTDGIKDLADAAVDFSSGLEDYTNNIGDDFEVTKEKISASLSSLSYAFDHLTDSVGDMKSIISDLSNEEPLEFVKLGDDFRSASDELFDSLGEISDNINGLKNTLSNENNLITADLTSVSNQFNHIMNLLIGEVENLKNGENSLSDIFIDVSDEDIYSARQGKIEDCVNSGAVEADRNTGGIVGNMAIEYSKDPEDDVEKPNTLNFTYRSKAILLSCVNEAKITGKKDCVGGIAGLTEIGSVHKCENYGDIESTNGNYVGGIVGKSDSTVRKSYSKGRLCGKRYIGGIAGKSETMTSCCTIVNIVGDENIGSVCGYTDSKNNLYNNRYVDNGLGALDGISYAEKCELITFDELKKKSNVPSRFISFTVTFTADGKTVKTQSMEYGDETAEIKYPEIPKKDGCFGKWKKPEAETITENITIDCEYFPYITILASEEKNPSGKLALALAEGEFTDSTRLKVSESTKQPPTKIDENVKVYNISLLNSDVKDDDSVTVRLLNENKDKATIWLSEDGKWKKLKSSSRGKYEIVRVSGTENTLCVKYDKHPLGFVFSLGLLTMLALGVFFGYKKHKLPNKMIPKI